jgi:hypothetical protein
MTKVPELILLLMLYGGLGVAGLLVLLIGARAARQRGPILAVAGLAGALILTQALLLYVLSDMSSGWGGDSFGAIPALVGITGAAVLAWFLYAKLRRDKVPAVSPASAGFAGPAAVIALLYTLLVVGRGLLAASVTTIGLATYPRFWATAAVGPLVALGLSQQRRWGWWLGLTCGALETWLVASWLLQYPEMAIPALASFTGLRAVVLLGFWAALLLPSTYRSCNR